MTAEPAHTIQKPALVVGGGGVATNCLIQGSGQGPSRLTLGSTHMSRPIVRYAIRRGTRKSLLLRCAFDGSLLPWFSMLSWLVLVLLA